MIIPGLDKFLQLASTHVVVYFLFFFNGHVVVYYTFIFLWLSDVRPALTRLGIFGNFLRPTFFVSAVFEKPLEHCAGLVI